MIEVRHALDLERYAGEVLGHSEWITITQDMIDEFARLSGDDHWIHVDVERAKTEMPGGRTIAHGLLILSLAPRLQREVYRVEERGRGLNYGYDRVRFLTQVPCGGRVRLRQMLVSADTHKAGTRVEMDATMELEGSERPALAATSIVLIEDA